MILPELQDHSSHNKTMQRTIRRLSRPSDIFKFLSPSSLQTSSLQPKHPFQQQQTRSFLGGLSSSPNDGGQMYRQSTPINLGFVVVPQQSAYVVERLGKFSQILEPGLNFLIPFVDKVSYAHSLKEMAVPVAGQSAITKDNVTIQIDGVLYVRVTNPEKASYGVENVLFALSQIAQTTMRSELGKISLDKTFEERALLNEKIVESINKAAEPWGIECLRYEIRDISPPQAVRAAMELEAEAERRRRADVLTSEGERQAEVNIAEGKRQAVIFEAEAKAKEIELTAAATAKGITVVSAAIADGNGRDAVSMRLAEQYLESFGKIAKASNTMILPANANDPASMVAQGMAIFKSLNNQQMLEMDNGNGRNESDDDIDSFTPVDFTKLNEPK